MIVNEEYYKNTYKGDTVDNFDKMNKFSQAIVEYLTKQNEEELLAIEKIEKVKDAICTQIEFLNINGKNAINGQSTSQLTSESYSGSYSYSKKTLDKTQDIKYYNGLPIAPMVFIYLEGLIRKETFIYVC